MVEEIDGQIKAMKNSFFFFFFLPSGLLPIIMMPDQNIFLGGVWFEESLHPKCVGASWVHSSNLVG
jgi:hypothetical protein